MAASLEKKGHKMADRTKLPVNIEALRQFQGPLMRYFRGPLISILVTVVLVLGFLLFSIRFGEVKGTEVGVLLNNLNGKVEVIDSAGTHIYNGITSTFYTLDKTRQTVEMVARPNRDGTRGGDYIKLKTVDGSNVDLDLTIQYEIVPTLDNIALIVRDSGTGDAYKEKWVRDYSRSICRNAFGELTNEGFYDAVSRNEKAVLALEELNRRLGPHGIKITNVIPGNFYFNEKYEQKIKEKKLADQSVEEEEAKARAAEQVMERMRVVADKEKDVALATFKGAMRELVVTAQAEAERAKKEADAYAVRVRIDAEAEFYRLKQDADAILATKKAEAEGIAQMAKALEGEGGLNLVKMEYAAKLKDMTITGQPFVIQSVTERFEHVEESRQPPRNTSGRRAAAGTEEQ